MRHQRVIHMLPEEREGLVVCACVAEDIQRYAVGEFHGVELGFLGD